jgi:hypothetical protein
MKITLSNSSFTSTEGAVGIQANNCWCL